MNVLLLMILFPLVFGIGGILFISSLQNKFQWITHRSREIMAMIAVSTGVFSFFQFVKQYKAVIINQQILVYDQPWLPEVGLNLHLHLDALSLFFSALILGIGTLIFIYAYYYLDRKNSLSKLYILLLLFMTAMLGIAMSNNVFLLLIFWEMTSISSFLLVGYWGHYNTAQVGARMALTITGMGGLALLGGFILLGEMAGTYTISEILAQGNTLQQHALFIPTLCLLLIGAFTKSAQFPFHFWLPNAMAAPTPVSAYLHSATMVKAGIFLLARFLPIFVGVGLYHDVVTLVGLITLCIGAFFAIFKTDLKGVLAYSTISHLGLIVCLLGIGSPLAVAAAIFHILNHALFKAALFMIAGIVDHETATRDMRKLRGLWTLLPYTGTLTMITAASMAGVPLTNGFLSKEQFFTELLANLSGGALILGAVVATLSGIFAVAYSLRLVHGMFFDGAVSKDIPNQNAHEPPLAMRLPATLLAILCILIGVFPAFFAETLINSVTQITTLDTQFSTHLAIWHGFNLPLLMSAIALFGGIVFYFSLTQQGRLRTITLEKYFGQWQGKLLFERMMTQLLVIAQWIKSKTEIGSLQRYLFVMVLFTIGMMYLPFMGYDIGTGTRTQTPAPWIAIVVWLLLFMACWMMLWFHHERIKAVLISGAVGLVVTITFISFSAMDLALTQITVDVVTTVLLLMGLALLPQLTPYESSNQRRWRDAFIAIIAGGGIGWISWLILTRDHQSISWFFMQQALPLGGGSNVVNVILVDFRGFDTFGEITVLGIAAIGALCMMDGMRTHGTVITQGLTYRFNPSPLMLRITASWVLPIALVVSLYIFLRGHNLPGGGFIAGLVTAMALIIQYIALGQDHAEQILKAKSGRLYEIWIGAGLAIAGLTGMLSWLWCRPFLTSGHMHVHPILLGDMHLASAALFDVGVYATVVGATMLLISVLGDSRHSTMSGPLPKA